MYLEFIRDECDLKCFGWSVFVQCCYCLQVGSCWKRIVNIFIVIALHRWWSIKNKCVENTENICRYISCWNLLHIALDDEVYRVVIGTSPGWDSLTFNIMLGFNIAQPILRFYFKLTIFWEKQISWN